MASSIFTFEPVVTRISSPWTAFDAATKAHSGNNALQLAQCNKIEPEPQSGPVEYKLHLLLRSRRDYERIDKVEAVLVLDKPIYDHLATAIPAAMDVSVSPTSQQVRRTRLEQLTTQLLWRLGQSSPHHASSAKDVKLPALPDGLKVPVSPTIARRASPALAESQGALYEIGVADDGTLVGLAEDELIESLHNLRIMATCLGCVVEIMRISLVGKCAWLEFDLDLTDTDVAPVRRQSHLLVVEAMVRPSLTPSFSSYAVHHVEPSFSRLQLTDTDLAPSPNTTQLRVSLTGATLAGKSSLLGTLSTSTLDDARGKSRLTLLKHRHEITSGVTSSIAQEIIGYQTQKTGDAHIVNFANEGVSSWSDIHDATHGGRIAFVSDSAGHPRYRRTIVRGLVGWAPHWVVLCVSANEQLPWPPSPIDNVDPEKMNDMDCQDITLDILKLCIQLKLPLLIAVTKLDTATKTGLRSILAPLLSTLKEADRHPLILPDLNAAETHTDFPSIATSELEDTRRLIGAATADAFSIVPIVMTSSVEGTGVRRLHAILHELPVPRTMDVPRRTDKTLSFIRFNIEDVYAKSGSSTFAVIAGHLRRGVLSLGDDVFIGPCAVSAEDSDDSDSPTTELENQAVAVSGPDKSRPHRHIPTWIKVRIVSLRDRRLPVDKLVDDQVGTIGLEISDLQNNVGRLIAPRLRKGMVLLSSPGTVASAFTAACKRQDVDMLAIGSHVIIYIASVRASARISSATNIAIGNVETEEHHEDAHIDDEILHVTFTFEATKEYIEVCAQILIMPSGPLQTPRFRRPSVKDDARSPNGHGNGNGNKESTCAGLQGFVGSVVGIG